MVTSSKCGIPSVLLPFQVCHIYFVSTPLIQQFVDMFPFASSEAVLLFVMVTWW